MMTLQKTIYGVCQACSITYEELVSASRAKGIVEARYMTALLLRFQDCSMPDIARQLGYKSHGSVAEACKQLERKLGGDVAFCQLIFRALDAVYTDAEIRQGDIYDRIAWSIPRVFRFIRPTREMQLANQLRSRDQEVQYLSKTIDKLKRRIIELESGLAALQREGVAIAS